MCRQRKVYCYERWPHNSTIRQSFSLTQGEKARAPTRPPLANFIKGALRDETFALSDCYRLLPKVIGSNSHGEDEKIKLVHQSAQIHICQAWDPRAS